MSKIVVLRIVFLHAVICRSIEDDGCDFRIEGKTLLTHSPVVKAKARMHDCYAVDIQSAVDAVSC